MLPCSGLSGIRSYQIGYSCASYEVRCFRHPRLGGEHPKVQSPTVEGIVKVAQRIQLVTTIFIFTLSFASSTFAQAPDGPQPDPPAAPPRPALVPRPQSTGPMITVPAGTHVGVVLENGISTASAKPGDSVYFRTSFPITMDNKVVVPVGSYLRGEVTDSKRAGRVKGKGELHIRLNTLILPNGYTVDLNAEPHSTDGSSGTKTDSEGKITGPGGKGKDAATIATTTATGAGIGAIADGAKGAGIGAGIGGVVGLAAVLLSRGPEAQLPRGSSMDLVLERDLRLDSEQIHYTHVGMPEGTVVVQPAQQQ